MLAGLMYQFWREKPLLRAEDPILKLVGRERLLASLFHLLASPLQVVSQPAGRHHTNLKKKYCWLNCTDKNRLIPTCMCNPKQRKTNSGNVLL
jgi:hypothetical protein